MDGNWFGSFILMWFLIGFGVAVILAVLIYLAIKIAVVAYILFGAVLASIVLVILIHRFIE